jgi:hypothetical protein
MVDNVERYSDGCRDNLIDALVSVFLRYIFVHFLADVGFHQHFVQFFEATVGHQRSCHANSLWMPIKEVKERMLADFFEVFV